MLAVGASGGCLDIFVPSTISLFLHPLWEMGQLVAHLTQDPEVPSSIPGPATYFRFSSRCFKKAVVSY